MKTFKLGQKVIVNTGGNDTVAIIDYPTIRQDINGNQRDYKMNSGESIAYLCRFTEDIKKCYCGGAIRIKGSFKAEENTLSVNAQYIPVEYIRPLQTTM